MRKNYELRIMNYEWGKPHWSLDIRYLSFIFFILAVSFPVRAQVGHIVTIRPDRAAPGMNVVVELLARDSDERPFGYDVLDSLVSVNLVNLADTERVTIGPPIVSWNGRLIQIPIFVLPTATMGPVPFSIFDVASGQSDTTFFFIDALQHLGSITHDTTIGGGFGELSASNTILVDSLIVTNAKVHFSLVDPDTLRGNPRLLPVVILSKGPVRLSNSTISVDADSLNGGPGGGGGGHGWGGSGGIGFTGGGSCPGDSLGNFGSGSAATLDYGGQAATGIDGGGSVESDQGGGGGTGAPYGASGSAGMGNLPSPPGGFGGGAGGGENPTPFIEFGGGGGGFGTVGTGGGDPNGQGLNGGNVNDGRFLVPMAGGSGGGAGNTVENGELWLGASGGGGGGAIELISYDSIVANSSSFSARGDSGISGINIAAGGGGGSGGAVYLASLKGIRADAASSIIVDGGNPGLPASDSVGFVGGHGGLGRVRIDGAFNFNVTSHLAPVWTDGISLNPIPSRQPKNGFVRLTGVAQDFINTLDTVRIFYRTQHSAWKSVDTVRDSAGTWAKWLPLPHDSVIYVVAFVEVNQPASDPTNYNYEPGWLVSDASMGIISHPASPFLVVQDTLNFGTVRTGKCKTLALYIQNEGEAPLIINKSTLSGSSNFSIISDTPLVIAPYTGDTIEVQFCPDSAGADSARITFISNDSADSPKIVTLLGSGLERHDSLVISPANVHFNPILVGECESDTVTLLSVGIDTLDLGQSVWNNPPFSMRLVPKDTALAPTKKELLIITFCPTDSGDFHNIQAIDDRQDSIQMDGVGVVRLAASMGRENLGTKCAGDSIAFTDTISNLGNDTITLVSLLHSGSKQTDSIGVILQPHERYPVAFSWVPNAVGNFVDTIFYRLSDTALFTTLSYRVVGAELRFDSMVAFHFVCIGDSSTAIDTAYQYRAGYASVIGVPSFTGSIFTVGFCESTSSRR